MSDRVRWAGTCFSREIQTFFRVKSAVKVHYHMKHLASAQDDVLGGELVRVMFTPVSGHLPVDILEL